MTTEEEIEMYVRMFGEKYRRVIENSLTWLAEQEPKWGLNKPIGRKSFLKGLISKVVK